MSSTDRLLSQSPDTPAFVYDELAIITECKKWKALCDELKIKQLFPLKCHNLSGALRIIAKHVDGFAVSSLFESQQAREVLDNDQKIFFTSPGLREDEYEILLSMCDGFSFNSLTQWTRFKGRIPGKITCGLRINPQLSFVTDERYDPCRPHSRLGVSIEQINQILMSQPELLQGIEGVHFHTNCDSEEWSPLLRIVKHLDNQIPVLLQQSRWINLGGGYLLGDNIDLSAFREAVQLLQDKYELDVMVEPGSGLIRDTCFLVSKVIDQFISDGKHVAVLDTTVNHMPEVFEYQFSPDVLEDTHNGPHRYVLAGATCLAGDIFGEYAFSNPLEIGSKVTFSGVGAYTTVKSHMFNGVNLPTVYALTSAGELNLIKQYVYEDFRC